MPSEFKVTVSFSGLFSDVISTEFFHVRSVPAICCLLFTITLSVYWPVRHNDFVYYDDPQFITENEIVRKGLTVRGLVYALTEPVVGNWHPVTTLSHMLDCELFGVNAGAHHLVNAVIHGLNTMLLFWVLHRMAGALWRSLAVAVLFALHPLRVESVAWVSERKDVLCWFFGLLALLAYTNYARSTSAEASGIRRFASPCYWQMVGASALALMSKAMLVTFPFLLLLFDIWPLKRLKIIPCTSWLQVKNILLEKLPLLALATVLSLITLQVQHSAGAMAFLEPVSFPDRIVNAVVSYTKYLGKFFWPSDLAVIYPHPSAPYAASERWPAWRVGIAFMGLITVSVFTVLQLRPRPFLAIGWFWFLGALFPVIGLVQVGEQAMADRYTYIPLIGPTFALIWGLREMASHFRWKPQWLVVFFVIVSCAWAVLTQRQIAQWRNTVTLFSHTARVISANPSAFFAWGVGLEKAGDISGAIDRYQDAIAIHPQYKKAHYNLGQIFRKQGQYREAVAAYRRVLEIDAVDVPARLNLANALNLMGNTAESISHFEQVLAIDPRSAEALNNLAWILATDPDSSLRNGARAVMLAEQACELTKNRFPFFVGTLAAAYAEAGRFDEAVVAAQRAIELATAAGQTQVAARNAELLELYRAGKPYHEPLRR